MRALAYLSALCLALAGCGSSDESDSGPGSGGKSGSGGSGGSGGTGAGAGSGGSGAGAPPWVPGPPPVCEADAASSDSNAAEYGLATLPPEMALADTFYTYDMRTNIGKCATDKVEWNFEKAPPGAELEIAGGKNLKPGSKAEHDTGGAGREAAKVAWSLESVDPGCYQFVVRWRAWMDCGITDPGKWGEEVVQRWAVSIRENHWWSGDLHVHTKHSEGGEEAGSVFDYYQRMTNQVKSVSGADFSNRRFSSARGRLHWLIFSDHTDREVPECGRVFPEWCEDKHDAKGATGRRVTRELVEQVKDTLLVVGSEVSNKFNGHFGFIPLNPEPGHPILAPGYTDNPTDYDFDVGYGVGIFPERWIWPEASNDSELKLMKELGGLRIINHETALAPWIHYDWSSLDFDGLEVWNGGMRHDRFDDDAYHGNIDVNDISDENQLETKMPESDIERSWLGMLKTGRWPMIAVGGSDTHKFNDSVCFDGPCDPTSAEIGLPATSVFAPEFVWANGQTGIADGLARGRTVVHDFSNFIDLRIVYKGIEYIVGDTIENYEPGDPLEIRAFGRVAKVVDGDNRPLLIMGTNGDFQDSRVRVLYNSEDEVHFAKLLKGKDHMRYIRADSNFDKKQLTSLKDADVGLNRVYFVFAQLIPFHNPIYVQGNGQDMALTGAIRIQATQ